MLRHSEQQRSYLGSSQFPSHPVGLFQSPTSLTSSGSGSGWRSSHEAVWVLVWKQWYCFVVLFREQQLFLSFLLLALFDDDLHYMDCYCNCINLYIYFVFITESLSQGETSVYILLFFSNLISFNSLQFRLSK